LNNKYNEGYSKDDIGYVDMEKEYFRTVTLADVWSSDELDKYDPYEESDGGGYITEKGHKKMMLRAGEWSDENEKQYRYDIAYQKFYEGIDLSEEEKLIFDPKKNGKDTPNVQENYVTKKPIVSGNKANSREFNDVVLDKFALTPLSYRILHELNPDSNMLKLYKKMQKEDTDYAVYGTGRKVGAEVLTNLYNTDGTFNESPFETEAQQKNSNLPQSILNIPFSIMGIQTEVPAKTNAKVTQVVRLQNLLHLTLWKLVYL